MKYSPTMNSSSSGRIITSSPKIMAIIASTGFETVTPIFFSPFLLFQSFIRPQWEFYFSVNNLRFVRLLFENGKELLLMLLGLRSLYIGNLNEIRYELYFLYFLNLFWTTSQV